MNQGTAAPTGGQAEWKPGAVIESRYELLEQIGVGGMGVVWKVHHREWDRELALKMPLPHLVGVGALRERFVREAETWVGLGVHPHIVQCNYVLNISGLPCLFLDYLKGGSLKERLKHGTVRPGQLPAILEIAMQVAQGLAHSHARGVIHRDVKPENLLFRDDSRVCVTDFGLVKTAMPDSVMLETGMSEATLDPSVSGVGAYLGTPQYGAPEQWGAAERVGPAADVYALGVTIYEMCCGRRPFDKEGDTLHFSELIDAHLKIAPPDPRTFYAEIPEDLAQLCMDCLEKDPGKRPQSMEIVRERLAHLHARLTGERFEKVFALPNVDNPDILNNSASSLYSLHKTDEARLTWRRGLRRESDHAECLYNLTQLERREGRIGTQEALRRLQQAKAQYPLALFCIEQGLAKEAIAILSAVNTEDPIKKGLVQRAMGDALMYSQQFFAAEQAYAHALKLMPHDDYSHQRKIAAALGRRDAGGRILFPSALPRFTHATGATDLKIVVGDQSDVVVLVGTGEVGALDITSQGGETRVPRGQDAQPVERVLISGPRVLLRERGAIEMRTLPDLRLVGRMAGRMLAATGDLRRIVLLFQDGPSLFDVDTSAMQPITGAAPEAGRSGPLAAFDPTGTRLLLLLATGEIAHLDENYSAVPAGWPTVYEGPRDASALALGSGETFCVGYASGLLRAYDMRTRTLLYSAQLPGPIVSLELAADDKVVVVDLRSIKVVLDEYGQILWQGPGPVVLEPGGRRMLSFFKGQLYLHELQPFHVARRWETVVEAPEGLQIGLDGVTAVSWDKRGTLQFWEVDEDHRVFERSPLLSRGQSYDDLVSGAQAFPQALEQAAEALKAGGLLEAYRQLLKARAISGYGQMPAALDLNWALIDRMGRDQIDAVWDRLTMGGKLPGPVDISPAGDLLMVSFDRQIFVLLENATTSETMWKHTSQERVIAARLLPGSDGPAAVIFVDEGGNGGILAIGDGGMLKEIHLGAGALLDVHLLDDQLLFVTATSQVGSYDLGSGKVTSETAPLDSLLLRVFPWLGNTVIVATKTEFGLLELGRKPGKTIQAFTKKTYVPPSSVSYAFHDTRHRVLVLGLEDGTLAITDSGTGRLLYAVGKLPGTVTGFALLADLAVGIVATARGYLYFWDLKADKVLLELLAHRGGINHLRADAKGRYLATTGHDGQVRLWETSWTASLSLEERSPLEWLPGDSALSRFAKMFRRS